MRNLIAYFVKYPIYGDMLMIALLMAGVLGMTNIKSSFFPETPTKIIAIQIVYPGASPEEVEEGIVAKIEDNLKGIAGVDQVKSVCSENAGSITVEVLDEDETDEILQDVKNAVDRISSFPVGMEPPVIFKRDAINFAISFAVNGDLDLATLKGYAKEIETDLRGIEGISQIELSGYPDEEIEVRLKEDRLLALNITVAQIAAAIQAANLETTGGKIKTEREELLIRGRYKEYKAKELRDIVVRATPDGKIIHLGDLAEVRDQWSEDNPTRSWFNGDPAVVVTVNNLLSEDVLEITEKVNNYIELYNAQSSKVSLDVIRDGSITLNQRIDLLVSNGIIGFLLVLMFLALFLNYRLAFWVALAIPVSFAGMFVIASFVGITINVVSLFGMILVIGILVDDGIVIAENIYQHYEMGESRIDATVNGTLEVLPAVFSAIVTTVIAFSSFYFIEGRLGDLFSEMATVVILTLVFSLVEGAFILPAHVGHSKALARKGKQTGVEHGLQQFMDWMRNRIYAPVLRFSMRNGWVTACIIFAVFLITVPGLIGGGFVKTTFFPFIEGDNITINLKMDAGTRAHLTKEALDQIEDAVWRVNKDMSAGREDSLQLVLAVDKNLGPSTYDGSLRVQLLDGETRGVRVLEVTQKIREYTGQIYGAENLSFGAFSPFGKPVSVSLLSNNLDELTEAADELRSELEKRNDLRDVTDNNQKGLKEVDVKLKPKAYFLGLTEREILSQLRQGFFGNEVQRLQRGEDEVKVWVRLDEEDRASVAMLQKFRIRTAAGLEVPLEELVELDVERGIVAINRLYGQREVQVSADIANSSVSATDAMADIKDNVLPPILAKYPEVRVSYEGQNRETAKSQASIQSVMPLIFLLMLFVIILTFRSPLQGLAVFLLIPFGLIGVSIGHWVLDAQISLFSILGVIALIGIMVNDSLVLVAAYNTNLRKGIGWQESIFQAGMSRFRPILLTSVTTVAGLAPLILNKSFQAQFLIPMAISVAFGLLFTTVIILVLLPIFLMWINPLHRTWVWLRTGAWPSDQEAEPAVRELASIERFENQE